MPEPTPYPEVNVVLRELPAALAQALGAELVGVYLTGSLAAGDFDRDSDVDVVVVTRHEVNAGAFERLDAMHRSLARLTSWCATQLEVNYAGAGALRAAGRDAPVLPNIERGAHERLKRSRHDESWLVQCHQLRAHGIALVGPPVEDLVDPVVPAELQRAMRATLRRLAARLRDEPAALATRGHQSYVVLSLCRILYTLRHGDVATKRVAARWAHGALDARWHPLIDGAWEGRANPADPTPAEDRDATLAMFREAASAVLE